MLRKLLCPVFALPCGEAFNNIQERNKVMNNNRTISFVNIFRNVDERNQVTYNARFEVNGIDVGARVYEFDKTLFAPRKAKESGLVYLGSKFPLHIEFTAIRKGTKNADVLFTNIVSMTPPSCDGMDDIEAMFKDADAQSTKQSEQPEQTEPADATDEF
jgi:hypothetical protein